MSEYNLTHFHVGKYMREDKMNAQMTRELQKAANAKSKEVMATITNEKVIFESKKEEIIRTDIASMRRNREHRIIVVALTKVEKKKPGQIFAMRFSNDDEFYRFFDVLSEPPMDGEVGRPAPTVSTPFSISAYGGKRTEAPSTLPSRSEGSSRDLGSTPFLSKSTATCYDSSSSTTPSQKEKCTPSSYSRSKATCPPVLQNHLDSRSPFSQKSSTSMRSSSMSVVTYVTTDTLPSRTRSSTPRRGDRVSAKDAYPKKEKTVKGNDKNHEGMVRLTKGDAHPYFKARPNAFISASPSSPLLSSSSTSATDSLKSTRLFRLVRISRSSNTSSRSISSSSSSSRRSRNASSSSSTVRVKKVNVWKYQNRRASNSTTSSVSTDTTTLDKRIAGRQSGLRSAKYVRCPTCHRRCRILICRL